MVGGRGRTHEECFNFFCWNVFIKLCQCDVTAVCGRISVVLLDINA